MVKGKLLVLSDVLLRPTHGAKNIYPFTITLIIKKIYCFVNLLFQLSCKDFTHTIVYYHHFDHHYHRLIIIIIIMISIIILIVIAMIIIMNIIINNATIPS